MFGMTLNTRLAHKLGLLLLVEQRRSGFPACPHSEHGGQREPALPASG